MMKTTLRTRADLFQRPFFLAFLLVAGFITGHSQTFKSKDGAAAYTTPGTYILNRYTSLAASENVHAISITVSDITELRGAQSFPNAANPYATDALSKGDLIMIIQMQGADIATTDDATYGAITDYKNTGNYELRTVYNVSGNMILLCQPLTNGYLQGARSRTQVIRVPRLSSLTVSAGVNVTGLPWSAGKGGVVAIETEHDIVLDGNISADAIGFNGGSDDKATTSAEAVAPLLLYRSTVSSTTAGKGEGIAGNIADYNSLLNGAYGRGAVANGGGGGNGHNAGGGGGSNAGMNGAMAPWNGTGLKSTSDITWSAAWDLEAASFSTDISVGGGRGGYTYAASNLDALTIAPNNTGWGGDYRHNVGGFGGRPLDYLGDTRLFMGGGGGAGDGNNSAAGNGGNGGGIVYILSNGHILGTGSITANGQQGYNTDTNNKDAAGGGGAGGAIVAIVQGNINGIILQADGGKGGTQLTISGEAEGPGGGGGGGYIATTATSASKTANGGENGISQSNLVTEFLPNGATQGAPGTMSAITFEDVFACDESGYVLPVTLVSFNAYLQEAGVSLDWVTANETGVNLFEMERSLDGQTFSRIAIVFAAGTSTARTSYHYKDNISGIKQGNIYYRLKMIDKDGKYSFSDTRIIRFNKAATADKLATYPNPVINELYLALPSGWQTKKVAIEIYDVAGKLIRSAVKAAASQTESLNMQGLKPGFYIVRATMETQTAQQRVIKK